jgi:serine phosphatase RsbU (regulator of sigma subunit)
VYDAGTRLFTFANAGHPPGLVVRSDGTSQALTKTGPIVGWSPEARFSESSVALAEGDTLVLVSDGITETESADGQSFGADDITRVIHRAGHLEPRGMIDALMAAVHQFSGGAPALDDRTVLIARVSA